MPFLPLIIAYGFIKSLRFEVISLCFRFIVILLLLSLCLRMTPPSLLTKQYLSSGLWRCFGLAYTFGEGFREVRAIVLYAEVFYLFVDGLDVFVDLALVAQTFDHDFGQEIVGMMVLHVDLTLRLGLACERIDIAQAELCREGLLGRETVVVVAGMMKGVAVMMGRRGLEEGRS